MINKKLSLFGSLVLLVTFSAECLAFSDVGPSEPASEAIQYLSEQKIINGYADGTFKPDNLINRAEFSKIIAGSSFSHAAIEKCDLAGNLPDISKGTWYYGYICVLRNAGVVNGYPDGNFKPEQNINFAEAAKIVVKTLARDLEDLAGMVEDLGEPDPWYKYYSNFLYGIGAVSDSVQGPDQSLKRGEMAQILASLLQNWWRPQPGTSWQWQLNDELDLSYDVEVYDLDLFDTPKETIEKLHERDIKVICYFSAGTYEDWREDSDQFAEVIKGKPLEDWPDEKWLDIRFTDLLIPVMLNRLSLAKEKGCDGVELDNLDAYQNDSGFKITSKHQLDYNKFLAGLARSLGLSVGLKNDLDQVAELVDYFDFAVNEQCFEYEECDALLPFIEKKKAVFGVEYDLEKADFCEEANAMNFDWLKMDMELDGGRDSCR